MTAARRRWAIVVGGGLLLLWAARPPAPGPFVGSAFAHWQHEALPAEMPVHEVLLLGDTGTPQETPLEPVLRLLRRHLDAAQGRATAVFLGDNVYPAGIPLPADAGFEQASKRLSIQFDALRGAPGQAVFVPGNHDWNHGNPGGAEAVARQQAMVQAALGETAFPLPAGMPGPIVVSLSPGIALVAVDTGWYLYESAHQDARRDTLEAAFAAALADTLRAHAHRHVLVVGHHPLYSNGQHSGRFPFRSHIFPLTELRDWAYIPLPVLGTLAFWYVERNGLTSQDLGHPRYRKLRQALLEAFAHHPRVVYAAGHEHSLQYFPVDRAGVQHHAIVSGSGAQNQVEEIVAGYGMAYGYGQSGLAHLRYYQNGQVYLDFVIPENDGYNARVVFRTRLS